MGVLGNVPFGHQWSPLVTKWGEVTSFFKGNHYLDYLANNLVIWLFEPEGLPFDYQ